MGNSTTRLQDCLDYCQSLADLNSVIPVSGYSVKRVLLTANAVMKKFLSSALKWSFNRKIFPIGITNSWQQDYATNLVDVAFLQDGYLLEINNTANPRPIWPLEVAQNISETTHQYGRPGQLGVMLNRDLQYATWGASGEGTGNTMNPQPLQVIASPVGVLITPANPWLQIRDNNGNLWMLTTFGTTGVLGPADPSWPSTVVFPSFDKPSVTPTVAIDGSCKWTAINPNNFGFRLSPLPPQTGVPYQIFPIWQMRPPMFTALSQTIEPIPDDYALSFMEGMVAHFYGMSPDPKIRQKHIDAVALWEKSLLDSKKSQDRTRDSAIMFPATSVMASGDVYFPNPAMPYGPSY